MEKKLISNIHFRIIYINKEQTFHDESYDT